jgi:hypothetical protein
MRVSVIGRLSYACWVIGLPIAIHSTFIRVRVAFVIVFISTRLFRMCAIAFTDAANLMNSRFGALPQIHS